MTQMESFDENVIRVEYNLAGESTGVEAETETQLLPGDPDIDEPFDPSEIDVVTRTPTVSLLLARLRRGVLDLTPDFQRRAGIWTEPAQSRLIESLLLRIPLPTLYAAEKGDESWVVVDGIQRLTTIARFVDPILVAEDYGTEAPLRLQRLEYLRGYEGATFADLPGSLKTRIEETELLVHLIRAGTPEPVKFNIFARINTGGLPLTNQELRHAVIAGPARGMLEDLADQYAFKSATGFSVRSDRMQDREMVLRFLAFSVLGLAAYRGDMDVFLREAMYAINRLSSTERYELESQFEMTMVRAEAVFGAHAFRKRSPQNLNVRQPINKALFESISVNLASLSDSQFQRILAAKKDIEEHFIALMSDSEFYNSISVGTADSRKVHARFLEIDSLFRGYSA